MRKCLFLVVFLISALGFAQKDWQVKFYSEKSGTGFRIYADNDELTPISAIFTFTLKNMSSSLKTGELVLVPPQRKRFPVATLTATDKNKSYSFEYRNSYNAGNIAQTTFDQDYVYELPFETGKKVKIDQGYNGVFSHHNQLALDFKMAEGSKIFAAREGKVVEVVENNSQHCAQRDCAKFNNKIAIMHPDGTFGEYLHLQQNGAAVNLGDVVTRGQFIGYSGNTGWSNGPHLHFSVFLNRINDRQYIQTKFRTGINTAEILTEKQTYTKP